MKFSNFLFPESKTPEGDYGVIEESLREAELSEQLGYDVIWLAEHHFDGGCAYVDPTTFAAAIAARTTKIKIGFAVAQMALHHPIRFAEQIALVDNISKGRMIVGVGRGTAYNFYEFRGFGINPNEAHEMLLEVEDILVKSWTTENYKHDGKFWQLELPVLRPQVYQKPHPPMIRACSGLESTLEMAREGRPFMMNVQSDEVTKNRMNQYRETMSAAGHSDEVVAKNVADSWVWRNIFVAETDAEAEKIGVPYFKEMRAYLQTNRDRMNTTEELRVQASGIVGSARNSLEHGVIFGSPDTVSDRIRQAYETGVGGVIIHFRLGSMPYEVSANSLKLFAEKVVPNFRY